MNWAIFEDDLAGANGVLRQDSESRGPGLAGFSSPCIEILDEAGYRAFIQDVECMWRWEIHREGKLIQDGCSLSESSSREAVGHVMSFYHRRDDNTAME
jgi:soluble methane monooxygenase-binding protein MmoD